ILKLDKAQQAARDKKLVPATDRVKIENTNLRIDPCMTKREETFQVALDILKKTPFYKAFLISVDILDICPRVENQEFDIPPPSESLVEFILELSYKGKLTKDTRQRQASSVLYDSLWGMYNEKNVDYATLIWEDFQDQIDHRQSKREGSPYHTINNDGLLERLKFINKGDLHQTYGKPIPDTWITDDIRNTKAYQMYFKYSTSLIPPKTSRGRVGKEVSYATKAPTAPKKATTSSKKKLTNRKLVLRDETDLFEEEVDHRPLRQKKRVPKAIVIQEPPNKEIFRVIPRDKNPKSPPSDIADQNESNESEDDDDDDERIETNDDCDDEEEEDDKSTNIKETDAERTDFDNEHQGKGDANMNIKKEVEKEMSDEKPKEGDITSMLDVPIQQDVPMVVPEPLHAVTVTVIPEAKQPPPPPPPLATTVTLATQVPNTEVLQANNAKLKKELSELNYKEIIDESVKTHVVKEVIEESMKDHVLNEVKNFLPKFLLKPVSDFAKPMLQETLAKSPFTLAQSSSFHQSTQCTRPDPILKKRDCGNDDKDKNPSTRSNQVKETKKRKTAKETVSSKKSSTPKESSRGKPSSKPSKSGKSRSTNDVVEETVFEIGSYDVDQTFNKKVDDSKQPSHAIAANPKRQNPNWYKKSLIPLLTFDKLMITPIDFSAFVMNRLRLTTLTREVMVGPVFNLLTADQQNHKFKEGDFLDLNLRDIEDMILLIAQQKIDNLDGDVIVDFVTALKMFTRSIVVQNKVDDTLHDRLQNLSLGFNPKSDMPNRAWSTKDEERTTTILKKIDDVLLKRRIMRSLELLVGGANFVNDENIKVKKLVFISQVPCQNQRDLLRDIPLDSVEVLRSVLTEPEVHVKMEMEIPHSSKVKFIAACSYLIDEYNDMMKAQIYVIQDFRYSDT
ncbi:hypothetical protein Tco_0477291, partial [Tanacetum coccineum]